MNFDPLLSSNKVKWWKFLQKPCLVVGVVSREVLMPVVKALLFGLFFFVS